MVDPNQLAKAINAQFAVATDDLRTMLVSSLKEGKISVDEKELDKILRLVKMSLEASSMRATRVIVKR